MNTIHILLADDHLLFRRGLASLLGEFEDLEVVLEAANGRELLDNMPAAPADVLLLDLDMPEMNGQEVMLALQEMPAPPKVIVLTMHDSDALILRLIEMGASGFLLKDAEIGEVVSAIRQVHAGQQHYNERTNKALLKHLRKEVEVAEKSEALQLSSRELEVLALICRELTTREIANALCISPRTVEGHRNRLLEKTGARNVAGLAIFAMQQGLID